MINLSRSYIPELFYAYTDLATRSYISLSYIENYGFQPSTLLATPIYYFQHY